MPIPSTTLAFVDQPEPITGDPERDLLYRALLEVENRAGEKVGWDQPPLVWGVYLKTKPTFSAIELRPIPYPFGQMGREFGAEIATLARTLPTVPDDIPPLRFADSPEGYVGAAAMAEGWFLPRATDEDVAKLESGETRVEHMTDRRIEVRTVFAADLNGNYYVVQRERGKKPAPWPPDTMGFAGRIFDGLQRLAYAHRIGALEAAYQRSHLIGHGGRP